MAGPWRQFPAAALLLFATQVSLAQECPGSVRNAPSGTRYCNLGDGRTFWGCHDWCKANGFSLPCPRDEEESELLARMTRRPSFTWIGLYQHQNFSQHSHFAHHGWEDENWASGCTNSFRYWHDGEPNDFCGSRESCAVVNHDAFFSPRWFDYNCQALATCICEMSSANPHPDFEDFHLHYLAKDGEYGCTDWEEEAGSSRRGGGMILITLIALVLMGVGAGIWVCIVRHRHRTALAQPVEVGLRVFSTPNVSGQGFAQHQQL